MTAISLGPDPGAAAGSTRAAEPLRAPARDAFRVHFAAEPTALGFAPGRVEILGNHTDYNAGLVMAAAIDRFTVVVGRSRPDPVARVWSANADALAQFDLDPDPTAPTAPADAWSRYARGIVWAARERFGPLPAGFDAVVLGDVPLGAGLSSSASFQAAFAHFLIGARLIPPAADDPARLDLARLLQRAENRFVGVASGLLDHVSCLFGRAEHAIVLDCRDAAVEIVSLGHPAPAIVVCDSRTSRRLADGMYNRRRAECDRALHALRDLGREPSLRTLRDVSLERLEANWDQLDSVARRRARHVLTENDRVRRGADALRAGDLSTLGRLMVASHASSRDDFENSASALDLLVELAADCPGWLGGKLSGAGWAGCVVHLVRADAAPDFARLLATLYAERTGVAPAIHVCSAAPGAGFERLPAAIPTDFPQPHGGPR